MDPTLTPGIFSANQQLGPTPTPQQIQAAYAQANTMKGQGLTTEPVHAWTQGVNQMLKALLGNSQGAKADALQRQFTADRSGAYDTSNLPPAQQQPQRPFIPPVPPMLQTTMTPPPANNAPASTYGAGVPYLYGAGVPGVSGGIGGQ
jgi:hypothetical protein